MKLLDGKFVSSKILDDIKSEIDNMSIKPSIGVIYIGNNNGSDIYIKNKKNACMNVGITFKLYHLDSPKESEVIDLINNLNNDNSVNGIMIQSPIPDYLDYNKLCNLIVPYKDVDGNNINNIYNNYIGNDSMLPCTVKGIIEILKYYNIPISGSNIVIIGRSNIVGKPLFHALLNMNASVSICHSYTKGIKNITKNADILISAIGKPNLIDSSCIKDSCVIIDAGISYIDKKICGDVNFDSVKNKVSYITPVPGGVGPMTISMLIKNTLECKKNMDRMKGSN